MHLILDEYDLWELDMDLPQDQWKSAKFIIVDEVVVSSSLPSTTECNSGTSYVARRKTPSPSFDKLVKYLRETSGEEMNDKCSAINGMKRLQSMRHCDAAVALGISRSSLHRLWQQLMGKGHRWEWRKQKKTVAKQW